MSIIEWIKAWIKSALCHHEFDNGRIVEPGLAKVHTCTKCGRCEVV